MIKELLAAEIFSLVVIIAAITSTIILTLNKWRFMEFWQIYKPKQLPEICVFCLGFWLSALQAFALFAWFNPNLFYIAIPLASASIAKLIYEGSINRIR